MPPKKEQQTPWCGIAYVLQHGLPGYPPPRPPSAKGPSGLPDGHPDKEAWRARVIDAAKARWARRRDEEAKEWDV